MSLSNFQPMSDGGSSGWVTSYHLGAKQKIHVTAGKNGYEVDILTQKASNRVLNVLKEALGSENIAHSKVKSKKFETFEEFDSFCNKILSKSEKFLLFDQLRTKAITVANSVLVEENKENEGIEEFLHEQERKTPPLSNVDTIVIVRGKLTSAHGGSELFSDDQIVEKRGVIKRVQIDADYHEKIKQEYQSAPHFLNSYVKVYADYTKYGKAIVQQQATRACTAATAAMLIIDNGGKPNIDRLKSRNMGKDEHQVRDIQEAGLVPVIKSATNLLELRDLIIKGGSCIVSLLGKLGAHVVVVDEVSKDLSEVRLRDPYHGWEITVKSEAFLEEWRIGRTIQIENNR